MDYRMEHRESQQFVAMVKAFPNEIINDDSDHSIPDFWGECDEKNLFEPMKCLRPEGKRDVYGLCTPTRANETHFNYGIGETWSKFYKEFAPQTGYTMTDDTDFEIYFEKGEAGLFCELWVPVTKG